MDKIMLIMAFILTEFSVCGLDISLEEAERLAILSSPEIKYAQQQLSLSAIKNNLDLRTFLPELSVNFSTGRQINKTGPDSDSWRMGFELTQPIFDGGRALKTRELTNIQLGVQAASLEQYKEELLDQIWQLFYGILLNREKLKLQKELLDLTASQLIIAAKKQELGKLTELDYLEASIEKQNIELDILNTENTENSIIQDFAVAIGFDPWYFESYTLNLNGILDREYTGMPLQSRDYPFYTRKALSENISLKQKYAELYQLKTEYEVLKKSFIPRISVDSSFYVQGIKLPMQEPVLSLSLIIEFPWSDAPSTMTAGGSIQPGSQFSTSLNHNLEVLPSLDFIVNEKTAELKLNQSCDALLKQKQSLERQIRISLEEIEQTRLGIIIRRDTQNMQKKRLQILEARNQMGEVKELDLLKLRIEFYQEEIGIREAVLTLMNNEREFEKLIGIQIGSLTDLSESIYYRNFR